MTKNNNNTVTNSRKTIALEYSYQALAPELYSSCQPDAVANPTLMIFNKHLAQSIGLADISSWSTDEIARYFSGDVGDLQQVIAQAYAGHQFGHLNILGDGRAHLLGELVVAEGQTTQRVDIQLKGSGRTPYSRSGDGKATLGSMLREYLMSEAMHALNIPSSRSLAVVMSGEAMYRQHGKEDGAILTRVASSHLRVGTFVYAHMVAHDTGDTQIVSDLVRYALERHYPDLYNPQATTSQQAMTLLQAVIDKQATLVAHWRRVGFVHGVMNTDNITISGETIDYGPCAFIDNYYEQSVFSSIDHQGRYAFGNQMPIMWWNMARFAESLLSVIKIDNESDEQVIGRITHVLDSFGDKYHNAWADMLCNKVGLINSASHFQCAKDLLPLMQDRTMDYTNTFVTLTHIINDKVTDITEQLQLLNLCDDQQISDWLVAWHTLLNQQQQAHTHIDSVALMQANNPRVIPRNHLVEQALADVSLDNFHQLLAALQNPYDYECSLDEHYLQPASDTWTEGYQTFCGT